jgi:DNA adenine methylase
VARTAGAGWTVSHPVSGDEVRAFQAAAGAAHVVGQVGHKTAVALHKVLAESPVAAPIVKWAGGKRSSLSELDKHVPDKFGRYFEPFVGGAALFFRLAASDRADKARLNDMNGELMITYTAVRDRVDQVIRGLRLFKYDEKIYYDVRAKFPSANTVVTAQQFIYLNRTGFNGLYRVNRKGKFNVPFGRYTNPTICDEPNLRAASTALRGVELTSVDFEVAVAPAKRGDFVYFDPPYWPVGGYSDFTSYTKTDFGPDDQRRLRDMALKLKARGVHVVLSNADVPDVRRLYTKGFVVRRVEARRNINSKVSARGKVGELIIT